MSDPQIPQEEPHIVPAGYKPGEHWMTVQLLGSGWAAVEMWLNNTNALRPFPEPYATGTGRFATKNSAIHEATTLANKNRIRLE